MRIRPLMVVALLVLTGCSSGGGDDARDPGSDESGSGAAAPNSEVPRLPTGKGDLDVVANSHLSPEGFEPELQLDLQFSGMAGWTSVHRGADGFDLGLPSATGDAPLVSVAFLVPPEDSAPAALEAVRQSAAGVGAKVRDVTGPFAALGVTGIDARGGTGQVVASKDAGIALDAMPGGRLQVFATDDGRSPLVIAVFAPDATQWPAAKDVVDRLSSAVVFAEPR